MQPQERRELASAMMAKGGKLGALGEIYTVAMTMHESSKDSHPMFLAIANRAFAELEEAGKQLATKVHS